MTIRAHARLIQFTALSIVRMLLLGILVAPSDARAIKVNEPYVVCKTLSLARQVYVDSPDTRAAQDFKRQSLSRGNCKSVGPGKAHIDIQYENFLCLRMEGDTGCWWLKAG